MPTDRTPPTLEQLAVAISTAAGRRGVNLTAGLAVELADTALDTLVADLDPDTASFTLGALLGIARRVVATGHDPIDVDDLVATAEQASRHAFAHVQAVTRVRQLCNDLRNRQQLGATTIADMIEAALRGDPVTAATLPPAGD